MSVPWCMLLLTLFSAAFSDVITTPCDDSTTSCDSSPTPCAEGAADAGTCPAPHLWTDLLEEWATSAQDTGGRHGRVMALPPTKGYYVTERIDGPLTPPPPPPHGQQYTGPHGPPSGTYGPATAHGPQPYGSNPHGPGPHMGHSGPHPTKGHNSGPPSHGSHGPQHQLQQHQPQPPPGYSQYEEWKATPPPPPGAGKIVNRPPNPYKDKFKPSYQQVPSNQPPQQSIPVSQPWPAPAADRVDNTPATAPPKQVSETDLYLLTAIEKLVYRADLMEKRLRKLEDSVHYLVAGKEVKPEPCANNFTRIGGACYQVSAEAGDWKAANLRCRKLRAHLLELTAPDQKRALFSALLASDQYKGKDFWTGGLNPGLLWIWSHSAKPVNGTGGDAGAVAGAGRCLALAHDPAAATYVYRGQDCALKHRFICELPEDREKVSNEIERVARELKLVRSTARTAKILWEQR